VGVVHHGIQEIGVLFNRKCEYKRNLIWEEAPGGPCRDWTWKEREIVNTCHSPTKLRRKGERERSGDVILPACLWELRTRRREDHFGKFVQRARKGEVNILIRRLGKRRKWRKKNQNQGKVTGTVGYKDNFAVRTRM